MLCASIKYFGCVKGNEPVDLVDEVFLVTVLANNNKQKINIIIVEWVVSGYEKRYMV